MEPSTNPGLVPIALTRHASTRMRQRGILPRIAAILLEHGDTALYAGNGCETLGLSRRSIAALIYSGVAPDDAARAARLKLVIADGHRAVTVIRDRAGACGRRYRRQQETRRARWKVA